MNEFDNVDDPCDAPLILRNLKLKNINRLVLAHLNINSLSAKFDQLKLLIGKNIDILVLTEVFLVPSSELKDLQCLSDLIVTGLVEEFLFTFERIYLVNN